jgi:hypothetical protein
MSMTDNFPAFAALVEKAHQGIMGKRDVFTIDIDGDALFEAYLAAFPEGTNPIFRKRTEHDCSCCKRVIRNTGGIVHVSTSGKVSTVWDKAASKGLSPYKEVAKVMQGLVRAAPIKDLFIVGKNEGKFGANKTRAVEEDGSITTWNHLCTGEIPQSKRHRAPDTERGTYRTTVQVYERGLKELSVGAVETVLELIDSNSIYRGTEHRTAVVQFLSAKNTYDGLTPQKQQAFVWTSARGPACRFRNTVIGTLVTDIAKGVALADAVRMFESKVAPQNYKRTTALITPGMVRQAMTTIEELGLESALERRFARIDDISVNDVLWVDSSTKPLMKGGIGDVLMQVATTPTVSDKDEERAEVISMADFMQTVVPAATGMEVLFKSEHMGNLMSLTAPVHPEPKQLFNWGNDFGWSYGGNVTDSIKERVKRAGGNVTNAKLRVSLSWFNTDDLDIHIYTPGGSHINYAAKRGSCGGQLDVDMNAGGPYTRDAVENVSWVTVQDGKYEVKVHNYTKRESSDPGFVIETESGGRLSSFSYGKTVRGGGTIHVATLFVKNGLIERFEVRDNDVSATGAISQERWGLNSETYVKVTALALSPNHWGDNAVGNKHTFFVIDGAENDEPTRGIYNEFLHPRLIEHRKVFEVIGDKTKCVPTSGQLSGLGFSSTKKDSVIVRVKQGKRTRLLNVQVGA